MTIHRIRSIAAICCIALSPPLLCRAQSATDGAIAGVVRDGHDAVLPHAEVRVHNNGTGSSTRITTDDVGYFRVADVAPGDYSIEVAAPTFADYKADHVNVRVGTITEIRPVLAVAGTTQLVEVSSAGDIVNTASSDFTGNVGQTEIDNLPINGRRYSNFVMLTPGVVSDATGYGQLSFRGTSAVQNNLTVDGGDNNQLFFSQERAGTRAGYSTTQVAVQEFQVNTSNYSAEYGRSAGGVVNTVTKSGTNDFHGEFFFYDRDNEWGATNPYSTVVSQTSSGAFATTPYNPKDWRKQLGFGVGGPIIRQKLFFFYAFDDYIRNFPAVAQAGNPTTFFANPDATLPAGKVCGGTGGAAPSTADAGACTLATNLNLGSYSAGVAKYNQGLNALSSELGVVPRTGNQVINFPKLDWQVDANNHVSMEYNRFRWNSPAGIQTTTPDPYAVSSFGNDYVKMDWGLVKIVSILRPNLVNQFLSQYGREHDFETAQTPTAFEMPFANNKFGLPPQVSIYSSTGFTLGTPSLLPRAKYPDERKVQFSDTLSLSKGNHNAKFGFDYVHTNEETNFLKSSYGAYSYSTVTTFLSDYYQANSCGGPCYSSFTQTFGPLAFDFNTQDFAFFATDDWKITPRLVVTAGVRNEYQKLPHPLSALAVGSAPSTGFMPSDKNNIGPRVGFAWDVFGNGKTSMRGGYGLFYGRIVNATIFSALAQTGSINGQRSYNFTATTTGAPAFPALASPTGSSSAPNAVFFDKSYQNPQIHQVDMSVEQNIGWNTSVSVSYLGNFGRQLPNFVDTNINTANASNITYTIVDPTGKGPIKAPTYSTVLYTSRPNPNFGSITDIFSGVSSSYNGLVLQANHRMSHNLQFLTNYTWSHALDYGENESNVADVDDLLVPTSIAPEYGNSSFNVPNRFVFAAVYRIPFQQKGWLGYLTNGFSIEPVFQLQSGLPYSLVTSGTPSFYATSTSAVTGGLGSSINGSGGATRIDVTGRNNYKWPSDQVLDTRLSKVFTIKERYNVELIGEAFNLLNSVNVTAVNNTGYTISGGSKTTPGLATLTFNGSTFGVPTNANSSNVYSSRQIQLAARVHF